jgi:hypothetical protein
MTYRVLDQVHVTAHINGDSLDLDFEPGVVDVVPEIGELLVAQGLAVVVDDLPAAESPADDVDPEPLADEQPARKTSKSRTNTPEA